MDEKVVEWLLEGDPAIRWHYDVLVGLDYCRACGAAQDVRLGDAIDLVENKRRRDGCWPLQNRHRGKTFFEMERAGKATKTIFGQKSDQGGNMTGKPLAGFKSLQTHHCVTGSMQHVYAYHGHDVSEDLLLGIGGGVGFVYWHMKGTDPFIGGRAKGKPGQGFEVCVGQRTGVAVEEHTTSSARKAQKTLLDLLDQGRPVMLQVDMGFLPYLDFGGVEYHFGAHAVVAGGYDPDSRQVLIADRDVALHPVSLETLEKARGSKYKPFPPKHRWFVFDFSQRRQPSADEAWDAIAEQAGEMLDPPISNFGVKGIRKTAQRAPKWPDQMDEEGLRRTLFNCYIFIDAEGGSGGGIFRYMFSRFLRQAAEITGEGDLVVIADEFKHIGDRWQEVAESFKMGWETDDPAAVANQAASRLPDIADLEEAAWGRLYDLVN